MKKRVKLDEEMIKQEGELDGVDRWTSNGHGIFVETEEERKKREAEELRKSFKG